MAAGVLRLSNGKNSEFRQLFRSQYDHVPRNALFVLIRHIGPHYRWGNNLTFDSATTQFLAKPLAETNHERLRGTVGRHVRNGEEAGAGSHVDHDAPAATFHPW